MTDDVKAWIAEQAPDALLADGFEDAIVGIVERIGQPSIVLYDRDKCIEILMADGTCREEAEEHFCFNVSGAWVGPGTPGFLVRLPDGETVT
jgi:hypothetical protein